jgi:hypothetical protein
MDAPYSFMIRMVEPHRFNILFSDTTLIQEDIFPWQAGTYDLTLHISTARPDRTYRRTWKVTFSELEIANLRNNISFALEETLGLPLVPGVYSFIQTPLNKPK